MRAISGSNPTDSPLSRARARTHCTASRISDGRARATRTIRRAEGRKSASRTRRRRSRRFGRLSLLSARQRYLLPPLPFPHGRFIHPALESRSPIRPCDRYSRCPRSFYRRGARKNVCRFERLLYLRSQSIQINSSVHNDPRSTIAVCVNGDEIHV